MTTVTDTRPLRHWLHSADGPHLVICCVEHPDPGAWSRAVIGVGGSRGQSSELAVVQLATCLADVNPAVLLELVAGGARGITVVLDGCASPCAAEAVVARADSFLLALGRPETVDGVLALPRDRKHGAPWPILGESAVPVTRRALFGRPDGLDLVEPSEHPMERLVVVLGELAGGDGTELDGIPTGIPKLTASRCAGSSACARTCPADALTLTRTVLAEARADEDAIAQFQLTFDPAKCNDCGQCLEVCPESTLARSGDHLWSSLLAGEPVELRVGLIRRCARCGVGHGGSGDLCAVCAYRAANPFGSSMPPGRPNEADPARFGSLPRG
jgi:ferredoxin